MHRETNGQEWPKEDAKDVRPRMWETMRWEAEIIEIENKTGKSKVEIKKLW